MSGQIMFILWGALCMIFGMVIMAVARVERGDLDEAEDTSFDFWIDDE